MVVSQPSTSNNMGPLAESVHQSETSVTGLISNHMSVSQTHRCNMRLTLHKKNPQPRCRIAEPQYSSHVVLVAALTETTRISPALKVCVLFNCQPSSGSTVEVVVCGLKSLRDRKIYYSVLDVNVDQNVNFIFRHQTSCSVIGPFL